MRENEGKILTYIPEGIKEHHEDGNATKTFIPTYSLSMEEFLRLREYQKGKCAICFIPINKGTGEQEHDHKSGLMRGLVCHSCNQDIRKWESGYISDGTSIEYPYRIQQYLNNPPCKILKITAKYLTGRYGKKI